MSFQIEGKRPRTLREVPRFKPRPVSRRRFHGSAEAHTRPHMWINGRLVVFEARPQVRQ